MGDVMSLQEQVLIPALLGAKVVTIPLAPRTVRAVDLAIGERSEEPIFLTVDAVGWTARVPLE
ncbi:MAG: hypothetical protein ACM3ML_21840 [Micromonosporaceae bacterium]